MGCQNTFHMESSVRVLPHSISFHRCARSQPTISMILVFPHLQNLDINALTKISRKAPPAHPILPEEIAGLIASSWMRGWSRPNPRKSSVYIPQARLRQS